MSSSQPIICVPCHSEHAQFFAELSEFAAELSEFAAELSELSVPTLRAQRRKNYKIT